MTSSPSSLSPLAPSFLVFAAVCLGATYACAATFSWNTTAGNWSAGASWTGGAPPTGTDPTTQLQFAPVNPADGSFTSTNEIQVGGVGGSDFQLNGLTLGGSKASGTGTTFTIATTTGVGGKLTFGDGGTINLDATAPTTGFNYLVTAPIKFTGTLNFAGNGTESYKFTGGMTGSGAIVKTGTSTLHVEDVPNTALGSSTSIAVQNGTLVLSSVVTNQTNMLNTGAVITLGSGTNGGKLILGSTFQTNQTLAGLLTSGTGTNRLVGGDNNVSNLTLNIASGTNTFNGIIGASTTNEKNIMITKTGAGELELTAATSNYVGANIVTGGTLTVSTLGNGGATSSLGGSTNAATNLVINGGTLRYTGATVSTDRLFQVGQTTAGGSAILDASGSGPVTFSNTGSISYGTAGAAQTRSLTLTGSNTGSNTLTPVVGDNGGGAVSLNKTGAGKWVLAGVNTYSGATTVTGGALVVGSSGSINNTSGITVSAGAFEYQGAGALSRNVTVNSGGQFKYNNSNVYSGTLVLNGGTLSGSGNLSATSLTLDAGDKLSPGNSPGTLSTGAQTWAGGGTYVWEINRANGTGGSDPGWDLTVVNGVLNITATAGSKFTLDITGLNLSNVSGTVNSFDNSQNYTWTIATSTTSITGFDPSVFNLVTSNFTNNNPIGTGSFSVEQSGTSINLRFNAIPEPDAVSLIVCGMLAWGMASRGITRFQSRMARR